MSSIECLEIATFIGRDITTVLKIAVDNLILELSDSCDYFVRPLLVYSPVELAKKGGRPRTNCNRSYLNVFWTRI